MNRLKAKLPPAMYEVLMVIINRGKGEAVTNYLTTLGVPLSIVSFGDGTAPSNWHEVLNYSQEKEVVLAVINVAHNQIILDALEREFLSVEKYAGIALTIPLKSITSQTLTTLTALQKNQKKKVK